MANCLVTKLQAVVDNDRLEKLGIITFNVKSDAGNRTLYNFEFHHIGTVVKVSGDLSIVGGNSITIAQDGKSCTVTSTTANIEFNSGAGVIAFDKYELKGINLNAQYEDTELYTAQTSKMDKFYGAAWVGKLSDIPQIATTISFNANSISGSVADLSEYTALTKLSVGPAANFTRAEITSLGKLVALTHFSGPVYGSLESLVAAQRANGRTTGTMRLDYINMGMLDPSTPFVTFNGSAAPTGDNKTLSWDATTITYDGVTITA